MAMKPGFDGSGITIHRSGPLPKEADAGAAPEAWGSRGVTRTRVDDNNTDLKSGSRKTVTSFKGIAGNW
jgi:hypothetical protein